MELLKPFAWWEAIDGNVENLLPEGYFREAYTTRGFARHADRLVAAVHIGLTEDPDWPVLGQYSHGLAVSGVVTI